MHTGVPLAIERRNGRIQALHTGHAVHLDPAGAALAAWGEPDTPTYWRSSPKPLQAIPFIEIMDTLGFEDADLALACASHSSEPKHATRAAAMLAHSGLDASALYCGTHPPMTPQPEPPGGWTALHNNCSGKHAAMLAVCAHNQWTLDSYQDPEHPLQVRIRAIVQEATGAKEIPIGVDGCGVPTFWLPIRQLARAYQWLETDAHGNRALDAMAQHPDLVGGTGRFCTNLAEASSGTVVGKVGAGGVYIALHRPTGEALAVKMTSGNDLAVETFVAAHATKHQWVPAGSLNQYTKRPIRDCRGNPVGAWQAAPGP